jgi:hypothetical protein
MQQSCQPPPAPVIGINRAGLVIQVFDQTAAWSVGGQTLARLQLAAAKRMMKDLRNSTGPSWEIL